MNDPKPTLIVVTGRPGSGKSTLAHALAKLVRCPAICRDEIKEGILNTHRGDDGTSNDVARKVYEIFFDTISLLLNRHVTIIAEAAFQHKIWAPQLEVFRKIANVRIIICDVEPQLAIARRIGRASADPLRQRFHFDQIVQAARDSVEHQAEEYDAPHLDVRTLRVNTSNQYSPSLDSIASFAAGDCC